MKNNNAITMLCIILDPRRKLVKRSIW